MSQWTFMAWVPPFTLVILGVAILTSVARLVRGPSLADRVVALDLMGTLIAGAIAVYAIATGETAVLHIAVSVALILFVGTVAFALYIEKGVHR